MNKINYKTSKDYTKLIELIETGYQVVCFVHDSNVIKQCYAIAEKSTLREDKSILIVRTQVYGYLYQYDANDFINDCNHYNLEYIQPTLE